jgi:hypothetical protein
MIIRIYRQLRGWFNVVEDPPKRLGSVEGAAVLEVVSPTAACWRKAGVVIP